jgi:ABC-type branched-subunit amino acid transport system ATPase component
VVLEDVTLAFEQGRLSGIMGPIGAGKTTCFNVSTGRYRPDRGKSPSMARTSPALRRMLSRARPS